MYNNGMLIMPSPGTANAWGIKRNMQDRAFAPARRDWGRGKTALIERLVPLLKAKRPVPSGVAYRR